MTSEESLEEMRRIVVNEGGELSREACVELLDALDTADQRYADLEAEMLEVAHAIGCTFDADGHASKPAPTEVLVEHATEHRRAWMDHREVEQRYAELERRVRALAADWGRFGMSRAQNACAAELLALLGDDNDVG